MQYRCRSIVESRENSHKENSLDHAKEKQMIIQIIAEKHDINEGVGCCVSGALTSPSKDVSGGLAPHDEGILNALHVDGTPVDLLPYRCIFSLSVDVDCQS